MRPSRSFVAFSVSSLHVSILPIPFAKMAREPGVQGNHLGRLAVQGRKRGLVASQDACNGRAASETVLVRDADRSLVEEVRVSSRYLVCSFVALAWPAVAAPGPVVAAPFDHEHAAFTALLQRRVHDGVVDYAGMAASDGAALDGYLKSLGDVARADYESWSRPQKLAFWIDAYNAFTIRLILDNYPLDSIRSIGFLPLAAFRQRFIALPGLRADRYTLNEIENDVLRAEMREPRIHFAIVCASKSCPKLWSEAYRASDLEAQLDRAARAFLADRSRNRIDAAGARLQLSSIFKWFRTDFEGGAGSLQAFVARYAEPAPAANARIDFLSYDWSLNGR